MGSYIPTSLEEAEKKIAELEKRLESAEELFGVLCLTIGCDRDFCFECGQYQCGCDHEQAKLFERAMDLGGLL